MIAEPNVKLLAHTVINDDVVAELMDIQPQSTDAESLVTPAGRSCYESWHRPRPGTYSNRLNRHAARHKNKRTTKVALTTPMG